MFSFIGKAIKVAVVSTVVVGVAGAAAFALMGDNRASAVVHEIHGSILESIDAHLDNPAMMRTQLRELEKEYPQRIAQVQGDMADIQHEIKQLEQEVAVAERVVVLAERDLDNLGTQVAAQLPPEAQSDRNGMQLIAVRLDGRTYSNANAHAQLNRVRATRTAYAARSADARHDLGYLLKQSARLQELLAKLRAEQTEFRAQVVGLNRQIDAIARNDRLLELLEKRNRTIEECTSFEAVSLTQITSRLDQVRGRQEAALEMLATQEDATDYEVMARQEIASESLGEFAYQAELSTVQR